MPPRARSFVVVVLGDFGRSPRMQYHALSLVDVHESARVRVLCYRGSPPWRDVENHPRISISYLTSGDLGDVGKFAPNVLRLAVRVFAQAMHLFWLLLFGEKCDAVLAQNPPCAPTFTIIGIVCALRGMKFVIDWHNLAYTLFGMKYGVDGALTRACERYERRAGSYWAREHLCVTRALGEFLEKKWNVKGARVVYDRAPEYFRFAARERRGRDEYWRRKDIVQTTRESALGGDGRPRDVADAYFEDGPRHANDVRVVVSSTSFTQDEDFGILLEAAIEYDKRKRRSMPSSRPKTMPDLIIFVTGKGPQKREFEDKVSAMARSGALKHVAFRTCWFKMDEYPNVLAHADVGVCLHTSSSGLDLPMKIVDMFGASLPVLAVRYDVIHELVREGVNGELFRDAIELATLLEKCFDGKETRLSTLRRGAEASGAKTWKENWVATALPAFL